MHVDRTKFLMFAAALSAGSCGGQQSNTAATEPGNDYDTTAGASTASTSQPGPQPVDGQIAREELVAPPPTTAPTSEYVPPPAPSFEGGMYAMPTPTAEAASDPRCATLKRPGPVCESFYDTVSSCYTYGSVMNTKAASAAVTCLVQKSGKKAICEFGVDTACALKGVKAEPVDKSTAQVCGNIMTACGKAGYRGKDLSKANCQAALSGYQSRVRSALVSCITEFCEISSCFYQVRY